MGVQEEEKKRFIETYESVLEREEKGNFYRTYKEGLNRYVAWINYLGVEYRYTVIQEDEESKILDEKGNRMKTLIKADGEGESKWSITSEWDERKRNRANRYYAENVALGKLFNKVTGEVHNLFIRFNEELWEETEKSEKDGKEVKKWSKKLLYGDLAEIKKEDSVYTARLQIKKETVELGKFGLIEDAQESLLKTFMKEGVRLMKVASKSEKDFKEWAARKEKEEN